VHTASDVGRAQIRGISLCRVTVLKQYPVLSGCHSAGERKNRTVIQDGREHAWERISFSRTLLPIGVPMCVIPDFQCNADTPTDSKGKYQSGHSSQG
jgi:hypothetical protein